MSNPVTSAVSSMVVASWCVDGQRLQVQDVHDGGRPVGVVDLEDSPLVPVPAEVQGGAGGVDGLAQQFTGGPGLCFVTDRDLHRGVRDGARRAVVGDQDVQRFSPEMLEVFGCDLLVDRPPRQPGLAVAPVDTERPTERAEPHRPPAIPRPGPPVPARYPPDLLELAPALGLGADGPEPGIVTGQCPPVSYPHLTLPTTRIV